ncbi:MAG: 50S ribosomal protein L5 [Chloroherpetonaceae bacterium]|nr:50S ribosomal protein L5 [Chloroherpetonaceae bacterium]MDW8437476.1 50S ribosomal protein L5 [Chloroherpetonaceae bacterium]
MAEKEQKKGKKKESESASKPTVDVSNLPVPKPRLQEKYRNEVVRKLMEQFKYDNVMMVPKLKKICINIGVGQAAQDPKLMEVAVKELALITGQKPEIRKSKKAISNFKLREGQPIGCRVTLRRERMYEFMDRLISLAIPRIRDFRGVSDSSFDGRGNYTLGIKEQIIFPEIDIDKVNRISGMDITFVTSAKTDEEAYALLKEMGMPFRKRN